MITTYFISIALFWAGGLTLWKISYGKKKGEQ